MIGGSRIHERFRRVLASMARARAEKREKRAAERAEKALSAGGCDFGVYELELREGKNREKRT